MSLADWFDAITALRRTAPTQGEKIALRGTVGIPSNDNRYVTDDDPRMQGNPSNHHTTHEPGGDDVVDFFPVLTTDPPVLVTSPMPVLDSVWFIRNGTSPETVSLRASIDGDVVTLETWTV